MQLTLTTPTFIIFTASLALLIAGVAAAWRMKPKKQECEPPQIGIDDCIEKLWEGYSSDHIGLFEDRQQRIVEHIYRDIIGNPGLDYCVASRDVEEIFRYVVQEMKDSSRQYTGTSEYFLRTKNVKDNFSERIASAFQEYESRMEKKHKKNLLRSRCTKLISFDTSMIFCSGILFFLSLFDINTSISQSIFNDQGSFGALGIAIMLLILIIAFVGLIWSLLIEKREDGD